MPRAWLYTPLITQNPIRAERFRASGLVEPGQLRFVKECVMKRYTLPAAAGLILLGGTAIAAADTIVLSSEDSSAIHEYVTTQHVTPVEAPSGFSVSVGAAVPDTVELHAVEAPKIKHKYSYAVIGKQTVVVQPETRKIIEVY
jgi:Protein of unknown function (DUF1236)